MDHIDLTKGNWLILTRTYRYRSDEISAKELKRAGHLLLKIDLVKVSIQDLYKAMY